jgi:septum formation protein
MKPQFLILASASPRRRQLLAQIGIEPAEVINADIDESPLLNEPAGDCVKRLAITKAKCVAASRINAIVIAADTLIACDGMILGKPDSREDAFRLWDMLSGRKHQVLTAVAVSKNGEVHTLLNTSEVEFTEITPESMEAYWQTGEPKDKAGAYAIQGLAAVWIKEIRGSYSGIMGLPLYETALLLKQVGIKTLL